MVVVCGLPHPHRMFLNPSKKPSVKRHRHGGQLALYAPDQGGDGRVFHDGLRMPPCVDSR